METRKDGTRVLDGKLLKVDRDTVILDDGREALREVVRHPGGVCIAALDSENNLWFVRQFRYAMGEDVTELPAGKLEWGEDPAEAAAREGLPALRSEVLIHGDYCLPNIILQDWRLSGYIDLGNGGLGDRHIDLLWGVWTLNFNLKTTAWTERFLDAYGRDKIDLEKLRAVAAMEMIGG